MLKAKQYNLITSEISPS